MEMRVSVVFRLNVALRRAATVPPVFDSRVAALDIFARLHFVSPALRHIRALFIADAASFICSRVPMVIRTHPSQPGSLERSRTSTPAATHLGAQSPYAVGPI